MLNIFVGYLFVFFYIKINGFDLLADFVGYALIYMGLCKLSVNTVNFEKAKPWTIGMSIVSFISCLGGLFGLDFGNPLFTILNLITTFISVYIMYLIDTGIREIEQNTNMDLNSEKLLLIWKVQATLSIGCTILSLIPGNIIVVIAACLTVAAFIANIVFLVYLYRVKKVLDENIQGGSYGANL